MGEPIKVKHGIIYIQPCYDCDNYGQCLNKDLDEVVSHLAYKLAIYIFAKSRGIKIVTSEKEWLEESSKMLGYQTYTYNVEFLTKRGEDFLRFATLFESGVCDGLSIILVEVDGKDMLYVGRLPSFHVVEDGRWFDIEEHELGKQIFRLADRKMVELMETDPKEWDKIIGKILNPVR